MNTDSAQVIISDNDSTPESEVGYDIIDDDTWVSLNSLLLLIIYLLPAITTFFLNFLNRFILFTFLFS